MPAPMSAGVFGMHRTMGRSAPSHVSSARMGTPAAMEITSWFWSAGAICRVAVSRICGLTARTMIAAPRTAARLSSVVVIGAAKRARCAATGSATVIPPCHEPERRVASAWAMLPPPTKAIPVVIVPAPRADAG